MSLKDMKQIIKEAQDLGFSVECTGKTHYKLTLPGAPSIFVGGTSSDVRSLRNVRAHIKRTLRNLMDDKIRETRSSMAHEKERQGSQAERRPLRT